MVSLKNQADQLRAELSLNMLRHSTQLLKLGVYVKSLNLNIS
jgi:hypothetical protein